MDAVTLAKLDCPIQRMTKHHRNVRIHASQSQLARHIAEYNPCHLVWDKCTVLARDIDAARILDNVTLLICTADNTVSQPFLTFDSPLTRKKLKEGVYRFASFFR